MAEDFDAAVGEARGSSTAAPGSPVQGCAAPPPTCAQSWAAVDANVARTAGIADPFDRNKEISAQYAELYRRNPNLRWVGLGSIVSRQAGCAMGLAKEAAGSRLPIPWTDIPTPLKAARAQAAFEALGEANREIYSDIYPAARFYQDNGLAALQRCASTRRPPVSPTLVRAFEDIDRGTPESVRAGSNRIAAYEQRDVIQERIYDNERYKDAFESNEWWARRPAGRMMGARRSELPLSADCTDEGHVPFSGSILNADDRVNYYHELMNRFERAGPTWRRDTTGAIIRQARGP